MTMRLGRLELGRSERLEQDAGVGHRGLSGRALPKEAGAACRRSRRLSRRKENPFGDARTASRCVRRRRARCRCRACGWRCPPHRALPRAGAARGARQPRRPGGASFLAAGQCRAAVTSRPPTNDSATRTRRKSARTRASVRRSTRRCRSSGQFRPSTPATRYSPSRSPTAASGSRLSTARRWPPAPERPGPARTPARSGAAATRQPISASRARQATNFTRRRLAAGSSGPKVRSPISPAANVRRRWRTDEQRSLRMTWRTATVRRYWRRSG